MSALPRRVAAVEHEVVAVGSAKNAMWQTPVSITSPKNSTPLASSSARAAWTSSTCSAGCEAFPAANSMPKLSGS